MTDPVQPTLSPEDLRAELSKLAFYHSVDVAPGVSTKGWFDLRHALDLLPWPDVRGKRCLDVGTWDGFYAYELERRGAAEVVAVDLPDLADLDYPPEVTADPDFDPSYKGEQPRFAGFHLLHDLLGSKVKWHGASIYDLNPEELGTFDVVVVGSLLIHLRDPVRALSAVRSVTGGKLLSVDFVHTPLQVLTRRRPLFELRARGQDFQWWMASSAGLEHLLWVAGFEIEARSRYFLLRQGPLGLESIGSQSHPKAVAKRVFQGLLTRDFSPAGHLHRAYLAHPRL